jgi:hypothetical protein
MIRYTARLPSCSVTAKSRQPCGDGNVQGVFRVFRASVERLWDAIQRQNLPRLILAGRFHFNTSSNSARTLKGGRESSGSASCYGCGWRRLCGNWGRSGDPFLPFAQSPRQRPMRLNPGSPAEISHTCLSQGYLGGFQTLWHPLLRT